MKKIIITGNVGRDPETRYVPSGEYFVTFSLAVTTGSKDNQKTDWLEISCNGRTADNVQKHVRKGTKLLIEGTPSATAYVSKEGKAIGTLRVSANHIEFIGSKPTEGEHHGNTHSAEEQVTETAFNAPGPSLNADEVPF